MLLTLEQAVLRLQQSRLLALRPRALRLLRLQLLHPLLQMIDASLTLYALARKHLALSFLHDPLSLLDVLVALFLARQTLAQYGRCVGARWCGNLGLRPLRHG
jgi:predicted membrane chloride channel (bestrophin family)